MLHRNRAIPLALLIAFFATVLLLRERRRLLPLSLPAATMQQEPHTMLWAWETPEDLVALDPQRAGVAFLAREVLLGRNLEIRPRHQPLHTAPGAWLMAVVRVEITSTFNADTGTAERVAAAIAEVARLPNVRAVQIDFDATASQRHVFREVLRDLRGDLPERFPISVTALVSWCRLPSWLPDLRIDEAVPMFFRMGGSTGTRSNAPRSQSVIKEPLCSGSVGVSADEAWPIVRPDQRVYLFRPGSWTKNDLARINSFGYQGLRGATSP